MNKLLIGAAALVAMTTSASAADLAARPYAKAPPPMIAAVYDWSGFYIGANGGYGSSRVCFDNAGFVGIPLVPPIPDNCGDASGALAGGQIGYNFQSGSWVFGLEAQGDWADLSGSAPSTLLAGISGSASIDALGLFTGRIGYAFNNVLLYVKGGAAVTSNDYTGFITGTGVVVATASETRWGGVAGAGVEVGFAPNWSVGLEYNHLFMDDEAVAFAAPIIAPLQPVQNISHEVDLVTVRVNYRWGGPVVAKY